LRLGGQESLLPLRLLLVLKGIAVRNAAGTETRYRS
jgi:hypothetical protein